VTAEINRKKKKLKTIRNETDAMIARRSPRDFAEGKGYEGEDPGEKDEGFGLKNIQKNKLSKIST